MKKGILHTEEGRKQVVILDEKQFADLIEQKKKNFKEHLYMGYLIVGTIAFTLGIALTVKRLNGKS